MILNHLDNLVHDWGWWNRAYTRLLIRSRGYQMVSMLKTLPSVETTAELTRQNHGAILRLEPRQSLHNLPPPRVALGEHAPYVVAYYQREFAPREDRPFVAYFRNPVLYGRQFSILDSRRLAFEECFTRDRRWREGVPKRQMQPAPKKVPGVYLLAGTEFHNHYAHLFCDVLPRWKLFEEAGVAGQFPALMPPHSHPFTEEAWQKMGMVGDSSRRWDDTCWQLDGLYFASSFKKFCSWTPESAAWIRKKLCPEMENKPVGNKLYYITRRNAFRPAQNEENILTALQSWGLNVVEPDQLSLGEQMALFSDARLIMGPHGAGIQNALWAPRGCPILELVSPRYFSGVYWTLAESLGDPYALVTGHTPKEGEPTRIGTTFNTDLIQIALEKMLKN